MEERSLAITIFEFPGRTMDYGDRSTIRQVGEPCMQITFGPS